MEDHAAGMGEDMNYYTKALWQERNNPEEEIRRAVQKEKGPEDGLEGMS